MSSSISSKQLQYQQAIIEVKVSATFFSKIATRWHERRADKVQNKIVSKRLSFCLIIT